MRKKYLQICIVILIISCLLGNITLSLILVKTCAKNQYYILSSITHKVLSHYPQAKEDIFMLIKDSLKQMPSTSETLVLSDYGYTPKVFVGNYLYIVIPTLLASVILLFLLLLTLYHCHGKRKKNRILELTRYLEQLDREEASVLTNRQEDDFAILEDEIYKTLTKMRQMKEIALKERQNLADNLADISHQIKTPVAAISLMSQLLDNEENHICIQRIQKQTSHLEYLTKTLLTLSRLDAKVLTIERKPVDIYTMLTLSLENLDTLVNQKKIHINLPNNPDLIYWGDLEWSIEAFTNLIKNCVEHTPEEGNIHIEYEENPLYIEIRIKDNGKGFSDKDLPHIFERFYRGENSINNSTGIGLALAKAIIEEQKGFISAKNHPNGALFTVRFYSHQDVTFLW